MIHKEIAFFDLDNTLWYIHSDIWIIEKEKPNIPLFKINPIEFSLIKNGIYVKDNFPIEYNDETYYISKDIYEKLKMKIKNIKLNKLGISYVEFFDENVLSKKSVQLLLNNIKHLVGKNIEIGVLTARTDRKKHAVLLNKLRKNLLEYGLTIDKIYFVSDSVRLVSGKITYNKNKILLEHMMGLTIEDNKFIPIKKDAYSKVYFYDDIVQNIRSANSIQEYFDDIIKRCDDDVIEYVNERIKSMPTLITNLVSNNELNPFETKIIKLRPSIKYPIRVDDNKLTTKFDLFSGKTPKI